jgi:hypothetical protein
MENFAGKGAVLTERDLIERTGLSEDAIRRTRLAKLKNGADWFRSESDMKIHYTVEGVRKLQAALGGIEIAPPSEQTASAMTQAMPLAEKTAAPMVCSPSSGVALRVERVCPNPIWVQCRMGDGLVNVRVRNNRQMERGKFLNPCVLKNGGWVFEGRCW